jgi:hypothetical protein
MDRLLIGSGAQKNTGAISAPAMRVQRNEILFACIVQQAEKQCRTRAVFAAPSAQSSRVV